MKIVFQYALLSGALSDIIDIFLFSFDFFLYLPITNFDLCRITSDKFSNEQNRLFNF